ncbi:MAG: hypothetical protein JSU67_11010 [Gammaproteobacteria bacterium]|nr:MAG: hypothetical protein EP300_08550 [Gammaproteobacteria bacterium]UCH38695.1 MAG: hypothetical protein JSU67_11010 [Gammaproteobacteria bacterium]
MQNSLTNEQVLEVIEDLTTHDEECEIVPLRPEQYVRESLSENFINEIEAWARHALAANGFGDY